MVDSGVKVVLVTDGGEPIHYITKSFSGIRVLVDAKTRQQRVTLLLVASIFPSAKVKCADDFDA